MPLSIRKIKVNLRRKQRRKMLRCQDGRGPQADVQLQTPIDSQTYPAIRGLLGPESQQQRVMHLASLSHTAPSINLPHKALPGSSKIIRKSKIPKYSHSCPK